MKSKPILFSREMVLAILDGRKTQTRRALKRQPDSLETFVGAVETKAGVWGWHYKNPDADSKFFPNGVIEKQNIKCPFGKVGDLLWVRENWSTSTQWNGTKPSELPFAPDQKDGAIFYQADYTESDIADMGPWRPSIFLPQRYARIELEITDVRVERLNDISHDECVSEGIERLNSIGYFRSCGFKDYSGRSEGFLNSRESFQSLWQSINGAESWNSNPFVWAISFRKVSPC